MTKAKVIVLKVKPIDMDAVGSHKKRIQVFKALNAYQQMAKSPDLSTLVGAWEELQTILPDYLYTDDGSDPMKAFEEISANQFDTLAIGLLGGPSVGEAKNAS